MTKTLWPRFKRGSPTGYEHFLWVASVFKELNPEDKCYAIEIIDSIPPGLSELYSHMMIRIEKEQRRDPEYCKNVLVASSLARRPLSLAELASLVLGDVIISTSVIQIDFGRQYPNEFVRKASIEDTLG
jgi:hypothetical protein